MKNFINSVVFTGIIGVIFIVLSASSLRYQAHEECVVVDKADDVTLVCRLGTINSELENTNFSEIQPQHTVRLRLECNDALFYQSSLRAGSFRPLAELKELSIEYCKIGNLFDGAFKGLRELRNLTVRTHNTDWSAMTLEVSPNTFSDELSRLERLDLSENNMWSLPEGVLCPLYALEYLNLTRNRLRELNSLQFYQTPSQQCGANLKILDLSRNNIERLPTGVFSGLQRLQKLYLQGNGLHTIADKALDGLTSLSVLKLSDNKLVNLPPELFSDVRSVKEMYLQNNSINVLAPGLFSELTQLQVLNLSKNELTSDWINSNTFSGLGHLVVLDISFNKITKLEQAVFKDLHRLEIIRLNDNAIETIPSNTFASLFNLHTLIISNNKLTSIERYTFNDLYLLTILLLDNNRIANIHHEALRNCSRLQYLLLNGNQLTEVPRVLSNVPMLLTLDLGENHISTITNYSFSEMQHMYGLRLTENNIENITKGVFDNMAALEVLNLSRNKIQRVEPGTFKLNARLRFIRLDGNFLKDIRGLFVELQKLDWLNISDNQLTTFDYELIPAGLKWLDIHANKITELGNHFEIQSNLSLTTFDASSNRLTEITASAIPNSVEQLFLNDNLISKVQSYTFYQKPNLTRVDLFGNKITRLDPISLRIPEVPPNRPLPEFYIGGNPYQCDCTMDWLQKVTAGTRARNQPKLMDLDSIYCKLLYNRGKTHIPLKEANPNQFLCKYESHCFTLCHCCDFDACDCKMRCPKNCTCYRDQSWSANVVDCSMSGYVEKLPEQIPMDATQLYLDGNDLRSIQSHAFIGRKRLKILFLNNSNIDTIHNKSFNGLRDLEILRLDGNRLTELKGYEFEGLDSLNELYLQHNRISVVTNSTFYGLRQLRILRLDHNRISSYSVWHLPIILSELSLASNPWSCDCEFVEKFKDWLMRSDSVVDVATIRCVYGGNSTELDYYSEEIYANNSEYGFYINSENNSLCTGAVNIDNSINGNYTSTKTIIQQQEIQAHMPLLITTLGAFVIVIIVILLVFIFRQEMRVWFHSKFGVRLFYRAVKYDRDDRDKLFDAFVSYSSKDEAFVAEELAPILEHGDPQYKLCLHYRDFPVGAFIADTIVQAVESSRRTIMVLSENFIKSEWCRFEFKSAHHQVLRDRRKRLIVVLLGEVPQKELDPDIRLYLKTNTYLQWGDKLFWEKLKFALPDVPNNQRRRNSVRSNSNLHHAVHHHVHRHNRNHHVISQQPPNSNSNNSPRTVAIHI